MKIKKPVLEQIRDKKGLRGRLCVELQRSYPTIQRWVNTNNEGLTLAAAMRVLREELELTDEQILDDPNAAA